MKAYLISYPCLKLDILPKVVNYYSDLNTYVCMYTLAYFVTPSVKLEFQKYH